MNRLQKEDLADEFMPLVREIVSELDDGVMPSEDLMQEGALGLIAALDRLSDDRDEWGECPLEELIRHEVREAVLSAKDAYAELERKDQSLVAQVELLNRSIDRLTEESGTKPNIDEIAKGRTLLMIAHRLSTVKNCDAIIAMDHGRIMEAGSHEQLMARKGYYYHLYASQE